MILSYKELRKRDVVNIADGRSFGKITDLKLDFPCATLKGIVVCERKSGLFGFWCKNEIFIDESQIVRIGGDVILINVKNFETTTPSVVELNAKNTQHGGGKPKPCPPASPCPPVPPCTPPPPLPPTPPCAREDAPFTSEDLRVDFDDY